MRARSPAPTPHANGPRMSLSRKSFACVVSACVTWWVPAAPSSEFSDITRHHRTLLFSEPVSILPIVKPQRQPLHCDSLSEHYTSLFESES